MWDRDGPTHTSFDIFHKKLCSDRRGWGNEEGAEQSIKWKKETDQESKSYYAAEAVWGKEIDFMKCLRKWINGSLNRKTFHKAASYLCKLRGEV